MQDLNYLLNMPSPRRCRILFQSPSPTLLTPESFMVLVNPRLEALARCREAARVRAAPRAVALGEEQAEERTQLRDHGKVHLLKRPAMDQQFKF